MSRFASQEGTVGEQKNKMGGTVQLEREGDRKNGQQTQENSEGGPYYITKGEERVARKGRNLELSDASRMSLEKGNREGLQKSEGGLQAEKTFPRIAGWGH